MREASQLHVLVPFPRFQSVRKHEFVRDFRALVMFVGGVERREETECVYTTEQRGDEERDREEVVVVFLGGIRRLGFIYRHETMMMMMMRRHTTIPAASNAVQLDPLKGFVTPKEIR